MNGALRAVPVAHQFLVKPCDSHTLRVAVERGFLIGAALQHEQHPLHRQTVGDGATIVLGGRERVGIAAKDGELRFLDSAGLDRNSALPQ